MLADLMEPMELYEMISEGYVRKQTHPTLPYLFILNYTEKAQFERVWNDVTRQCRGLIVEESGRVVARPFDKFFNYGEGVTQYDPRTWCRVTDKMDGSLGIVYPTPNGPAVATRGSFTSEQAVHATKLLHSRYAGWAPPNGFTVMFEIIYPSNRIVVDYGGWDDLVLIGARGISTGTSLHLPLVGWTGPVTETFSYTTLAEALSAPPRPGAEGLVVHFGDDTRLKIKQEDYVQLHRILTGFTARRLWERCAVNDIVASRPDVTAQQLNKALKMDPATAQGIMDAGPDWLDIVREVAPEEFLGWIDDTVTSFKLEVGRICWDVVTIAASLSAMPRKKAAAHIKDHPLRGMIFAQLDHYPIDAQAWLMVYPEHEKPFWNGDAS